MSEFNPITTILALGMLIFAAKLFAIIFRRMNLPEVVGDCGIYVDSLDPKSEAGGIKNALSAGLGLKARHRIVTKFPIQKRKHEILNSIENLFN